MARRLYKGDYVDGPIAISVAARETASSSDDTFETQTLSLKLDLNELTGNDEVTVTMKPEAPQKPPLGAKAGGLKIISKKKEESASYTVYFSYQIIPAVEITNVDVVKDEIAFDILPEGLGQGNASFTIYSARTPLKPIVMITTQLTGGINQKAKFDWNKFDQTSGAVFPARSLKIVWSQGKFSAEDVWDVGFTGYGKFLITKFYTPKESDFGPPDTVIPKDAPCFSEKSTTKVNGSWASSVSANEGVGESQGILVHVRRCERIERVSR